MKINYKFLHPTETMERITRAEFAANLDAILDKVTGEDVGIVITEDSISSLRRFKDDVKEVQTGFECGIGLEKFNDIKVGDVLEAYIMEGPDNFAEWLERTKNEF